MVQIYSTKLEFYNSFKNAYIHLLIIYTLKKLVKFRIGHHKLVIEGGRYDQIPRVNRLCPTGGSDQIEDEMHYFYTAPNTQFLKTNFTGKWNISYRISKKLLPTEAAKELMNSANYFVDVQLTKFILTCSDVRNTYLSMKSN